MNFRCRNNERRRMKSKTFYTNKKYLELKGRLGWKEERLLLEVVGDAIQYGITEFFDKLQESMDKCSVVKHKKEE